MAEDWMIPTIEIAIGAMITEGTRISMTTEEISMTIVAINRMGRVIHVGTARTRASRNIEGIDTGQISKVRWGSSRIIIITMRDSIHETHTKDSTKTIVKTTKCSQVTRIEIVKEVNTSNLISNNIKTAIINIKDGITTTATKGIERYRFNVQKVLFNLNMFFHYQCFCVFII